MTARSLFIYRSTEIRANVKIVSYDRWDRGCVEKKHRGDFGIVELLRRFACGAYETIAMITRAVSL